MLPGMEQTPPAAASEADSHGLRRALGLPDLVSMQVLLVLGVTWASNAAHLGPTHVIYWLLGAATLFLPIAAVVNFCAPIWPLEGGVYQWTRHAIGPFAGFMSAWNFGAVTIFTCANLGILTATSLSYALGPSAAWMATSTPLIMALNIALFSLILAVNIPGFAIARWVAHFGTSVMLLVMGLLALLLVWHPDARAGHPHVSPQPPFALGAPALTLLSINLFVKLTFNSFSGLEQVAVFAGEARDAGRAILRSAWIAAPLIAAIYIMMTGAMLTYTPAGQVDLNGPVPQLLATAFGGSSGGLNIGQMLGSVAILALAVSLTAQYSVSIAEASRLPMVAAWDHLLPAAFTRLHPRFRTPVLSIATITGLTLGFALLASAGASAAEAFQLIVAANNVSYAIFYVLMFAVPLLAGTRFSARPDLRPGLALRLACVSGIIITVLAMAFTLIPIVYVPSAYIFAAKVVLTALAINALGSLLYWRALN